MKNCIIKVCTAEQARSRARIMKMDEFITDDEIFGISDETFDTLNNETKLISSHDVVVEIVSTSKIGEYHKWYVPKIFLDILSV